MQLIRITLLFMLFGFVFSSHLYAKSEINTGFFSNAAIEKYDAVAYFTLKKPVKGNDQYKTSYKEASWYFMNKENLDLFIANPEKYAPKYGGYCAWAVAQGDTANGNPKNWTVYKNKLYLNYNDSIQNKWLKKIDEFIIKADKKWPGVIQ